MVTRRYRHGLHHVRVNILMSIMVYSRAELI